MLMQSFQLEGQYLKNIFKFSNKNSFNSTNQTAHNHSIQGKDLEHHTSLPAQPHMITLRYMFFFFNYYCCFYFILWALTVQVTLWSLLGCYAWNGNFLLLYVRRGLQPLLGCWYMLRKVVGSSLNALVLFYIWSDVFLEIIGLHPKDKIQETLN